MNSAIAAFNPFLDAAADVYHVPEAGNREELRGHRAVGRRLTVDEHSLVLVGQQFRQMHLDRVEGCAYGARDVPLRSAIGIRGSDVDDHDLLAVENHLRRNGGGNLGIAAARLRDADGAAGRQKDEGRKQKCSAEPRFVSRRYFCLLPSAFCFSSAFCLHNISSSKSARTSPTTVPTTLVTGIRRNGCNSGESSTPAPRISSVFRITGLRPRPIDPSWILRAMPTATSSATRMRPVNAATSDGAR